MADEPAGLAPGQLGDIRILLLGKHRRTGGKGIVEPHEPELGRRPQNQLLPDPRQVDPQQGHGEQGLGHEVPVGHGIQRVLEAGGEAQVSRHAVGIQRQRRPGQRAGTQRRHVSPVPGVHQPVDVAGQRPAVGQQVMGQEDRLGLLEVRVAREVGATRLVGPISQCGLERGDQAGQVGQFVEDPEPEVGGHLVVSAPAGVQPGPRFAGQLGDPPLDRSVDVLVGRHKGEGSVGQLSLRGIQRLEHRRGIGVGHEPDPGQHPDVGPRTGHVLPEHPPVERQAVIQGLQGLTRSALEPTVPEGRHGNQPPALAARRATVRSRRAFNLMNPSASAWS